MVQGAMPFYEIRSLKDSAVLKSDIWAKAEAIADAVKLGKKHKTDVAVYQLKQVFATDTGEAEIEF